MTLKERMEHNLRCQPFTFDVDEVVGASPIGKLMAEIEDRKQTDSRTTPTRASQAHRRAYICLVASSIAAVAALASLMLGCGTSTMRTPSGLRYDGAAPGQWLRDDGATAEFGGFTEPPNFVGVDRENAVRKATSLPSTTMVYDLFVIDSPKDLTIEDAEIELVDGQPVRIRLGKLTAIVSDPIRADAGAIKALAEWVRELNQTQRESIEAIAPGVLGLIDALVAGL